ncbi:hypothetical protein ACO1O0_005805 [Amphichorda felina]
MTRPSNGSDSSIAGSGRSRTKGKRAFHNKVRTGCKTCKIRRVRCDEQRPACNRCVSTGRKCDGYATDPAHWASFTNARSSNTSSTTGSATPALSLSRDSTPPEDSAMVPLGPGARLQFLSGDPKQTRSFRYFLSVAAPAIAGTFNSRFWTEEIPRACHEDPAIWHAIISLGTVYEDHVALSATKSLTKPYRNPFAIQNFNQSVQHLIKPGPRTNRDKWRALVASIVFTAVCMVEGLYDQARMHFKAGCNLLSELEAEELSSDRDSPPIFGPEHERGPRTASSISPAKAPLVPVSASALKSVLVGLDLWLQGMTNSGVLTISTLAFPEDAVWSVWESYSAPRASAKAPKVLTRENLTAASRAAESLVYANVVFAHRNNREYERLFVERDAAGVNSIGARQKPLINSFKELYKAVTVFGWELDEACGGDTETESLETAQLRLSFYFVSAYLATIRIFLVPIPKEFNLSEDFATFGTACAAIVRLSEKIYTLEASIKSRSRQTVLGSNPPLATPLSIASVVAPTHEVRRQAIKMVRRPRIEGFLENTPIATLFEAILAGELEADREYRQQVAAGGPDTDPKLKGHVPVEGEVHPLSRTYASGFASSSRGEGVVRVRTWRDLITGSEGRKIKVTW